MCSQAYTWASGSILYKFWVNLPHPGPLKVHQIHTMVSSIFGNTQPWVPKMEYTSQNTAHGRYIFCFCSYNSELWERWQNNNMLACRGWKSSSGGAMSRSLAYALQYISLRHCALQCPCYTTYALCEEQYNSETILATKFCHKK